jgi:undecaprenyl-diphosphatase
MLTVFDELLCELDEHVLRLAGGIAGRWPLFDKIAVSFAGQYSVRLMPLMAVLIYLWFRTGNGGRSRRTAVETIIGMRAVIEAIIAALVAGTISCLMRDLLPFRSRPYQSGDPAFVAPIGMPNGLIADLIEQGNSFPCDHAAIAIALATAVWLASRPLGTLCYAWVALTTCLPRIYVGYHYASDILVGVIVGLDVALGVRLLLPTVPALKFTSRIALRNPALFQVALFILLFQSVMVFDEIRLAFRGSARTSLAIGQLGAGTPIWSHARDDSPR